MTDRARLQLHDTGTGAVRDFVPLRPQRVSIYLRGAAVQGLAHIGHVRSGFTRNVSAHYRSMLEFSETALQDAVEAYVGIEDFPHRVRGRVGVVESGQWTPRFAKALDDDLAVPVAAAEAHHARAEGNRALDAGDQEGALANAAAIRKMMGVLGCDPLDERRESRDETSAALAAVDVLVRAELQRHEQAREERDWKLADEIRDRLKDAGIEVTDTTDSPQWARGIQADGR